MRLLTKDEVCRELGMSLSTLDRRISAGDLVVRREPRGRRQRVFVLMDDSPAERNGTTNAFADAPFANTQLVVARERIRGLEERVKLLQEQLKWEHERNVELFSALNAGVPSPASRQRRRAWWRFWDRR